MTVAGYDVRRVLVVATDPDDGLARHMPLIAAITASLHQVVCLISDASPTATAALLQHGAVVEPITLKRRRFSPLADYRVRRGVAAALINHAPDVILVTALDTLGLIASALDPTVQTQVVFWPGQDLVEADLRHACRDEIGRAVVQRVSGVVVETESQRRLVAKVIPSAKTYVIPAVGIDLTATAALPLPAFDGGLVIRCLTPGSDPAAHAVFKAVARQVGSLHPAVRFATGASPDQLAGSHLVMHTATAPGLPCELPLALALGRPVMTADVDGANATVDERVNGWRVPPGDVGQFVEACLAAIRHPDLLPGLARASRTKAARCFDRRAHLTMGLESLGVRPRRAVAAA